ncbi:cupin domain-containing protein [Halobacteriales archaeon QS_4_70_19]|nr:MAG: cupin domain-containing protein [Halobacteriales archaeon QS_4_70_19]
MSTATGQSRTYDVQLAALGARLDVAPEESESGVAVVYHTLAPHALGAPLHRHSREDEISRVVRGELTVMQDGEITTAAPGETVVKPRGVRHTFRNAGNEPVGFVEVIAPGEFAACFGEAADTVPAGGLPDQAALDRLTELGVEYGMESRMESISEPLPEHGSASECPTRSPSALGRIDNSLPDKSIIPCFYSRYPIYLLSSGLSISKPTIS